MKEGDTEILMECIKFEDSDDFKAFSNTGWSWRHVRVWPATLDRLEKEGYVMTKLKTESYHGYIVTGIGKMVFAVKKCPDCYELHDLISQGKASMMPSKCYPSGGSPCPFIKLPRETLPYPVWKLKLIELITTETRVNSVIKIEEIKCALRNGDAYSENYTDGDTPEEAWQGEMEAIEDSQ